MAIAADRVWGRFRARRPRYLLLAAADQSALSFAPDHIRQQVEFHRDAEFVRRIEQMEPPEAMIFQLPYVPFPEGPPAYHMAHYDLFLPDLHSRGLRRSYGAMKGRQGDLWQQRTASMVPGDMVETLTLAGFSGIYIDSDGYPDGARQVKAELSKILDASPI